MTKSIIPPVGVTRAAIQQHLDEYTDTHYRLIIEQQRRSITKLERRVRCLQRKLPL